MQGYDTYGLQMQDSDVEPRRLLSETDLEIIDALQINPRASWVDAARRSVRTR